MMTHKHKVLLAAWWAITVTALAAHAWALDCAAPLQVAELALESVTNDGESATDLVAYDELVVTIYAHHDDSIVLQSGDYSEPMMKEGP